MRKKWKYVMRNIRYRVLTIVRKIWNYMYGFLKKIPLLLIFSVSIVVMLLIIYFLFVGDVNADGEIVIYKFAVNISLLDILLSNISLLAAVLAIVIELKKPKLKIWFLDGHGSVMSDKKGQVPIGIDEDGFIGYQLCVPSDWNMYLVNVGQRTAENIRVRVSIDGILFDHSLAEKGYDLDNFVYGSGVFKNIYFDLIGLLRQGEKIEIPKIPFEYCELESDNFKEWKYTYLRISLYCNNQDPIHLKYKLTIEPYDLMGKYDYGKKREAQYLENSHIENWVKEYVDWYKEKYSETTVDIYNYFTQINPYVVKKYKKIEQSKEIFEYYLLKDSDKMIFWGRIYYLAKGMKPRDIEAVLQTQLLKEQIKGDKTKVGKYYI